MAKNTIHEDEHGVFIKADGGIFRPIHPAGSQHLLPNGSSFQVGDKVNAKHWSGSTLASVTKDGEKEIWHYHGSYLGAKSKDCFKPDYLPWD